MRAGCCQPETGARSSQLSAMGNGHGLYLVPWFENRSAWTEAMAGAHGIEQTTWNSINHAKKRPERVQTRVNVSPLCASVCAIGYSQLAVVIVICSRRAWGFSLYCWS